MQSEIKKGYDGAETMQSPRRLCPSDNMEQCLGPISVVELQGHAGNHQQQKACHH